MEALGPRIRRSLTLFDVFREREFTFRYEDENITVFKETTRPGQTISQLMFIQPVGSPNDAAEFIESFLKKV